MIIDTHSPAQTAGPPLAALVSAALYAEPVFHLIAYTFTIVWTSICIVQWLIDRNRKK